MAAHGARKRAFQAVFASFIQSATSLRQLQQALPVPADLLLPATWPLPTGRCWRWQRSCCCSRCPSDGATQVSAACGMGRFARGTRRGGGGGRGSSGSASRQRHVGLEECGSSVARLPRLVDMQRAACTPHTHMPPRPYHATPAGSPRNRRQPQSTLRPTLLQLWPAPPRSKSRRWPPTILAGAVGSSSAEAFTM